MVGDELQSILGKLGIDYNSGEMQVFRAVLIAAGGTEKPVRYSEVATALEYMTKKTFTKAYIYRQLKSLDKSKFIKIRHTNPRTYTVVQTNLSEALETKIGAEKGESIDRKQDLENRYKQLSKIRSQDLALLMHEQLTGNDINYESGVIEGVENVRSAIIREFADASKEGDTVRVLAHASTSIEGLGPGGATEFRLIQSVFKGVKVVTLATTSGDSETDVNLIADHLVPMIDLFTKAAETGIFQIRSTQEPVNTYRMVSLNEDKMLLYLTHAKESDMAALIHREDNPGLIDDALQTFDELWETGIDVVELVKKMYQKREA